MLPSQDQLPILQLAGKTGTVLERLDADAQAKPLPISRDEMLDRGWDSVDVVFVTGEIRAAGSDSRRVCARKG